MDLASTASADAGTTTNAGTSGNAGTIGNAGTSGNAGTIGNAGVPNAADPAFAGGNESARVPSSAYLAAHTEREPGTVSVTEVVASGECASANIDGGPIAADATPIMASLPNPSAVPATSLVCSSAHTTSRSLPAQPDSYTGLSDASDS
jgi:hypothetical protein